MKKACKDGDCKELVVFVDDGWKRRVYTVKIMMSIMLDQLFISCICMFKPETEWQQLSPNLHRPS